MKTKSLLASALILLAVRVSADGDSHRQAVERLLEVTNVKQMLEQMRPQSDALIEQLLSRGDTTKEQEQILREFAGEIEALNSELLSWEVMREDFVSIYLKVFDEAEIYELVGFYESPTGRKLVAKLPAISHEIVVLAGQRRQEMTARLGLIQEKYQQRLQDAR